MDKSKEQSKMDAGWRVEEPDEAKYNFSDEKGLWQPKPGDILSMFEKLAQGGVLPLKWTCPGRRPPDKFIKEEEDMEEGMDEDDDESKEEESRTPETSAFDFDEMHTDIGAKLTPRVTPGGVGRTPRTEKRVARMDNIMDSLRKQQIQRAAEREARKAKGSPSGVNTNKKRLLNFDSPGPKSVTGGSKSTSNSPARVASPSRAVSSGMSETVSVKDTSNLAGNSSTYNFATTNSPSETPASDFKPSKPPVSTTDANETSERTDSPGSNSFQSGPDLNPGVAPRESDSSGTKQLSALSETTSDIHTDTSPAPLGKLESNGSKNTFSPAAAATSSNNIPTTASSTNNSDVEQIATTTVSLSEKIQSEKEITTDTGSLSSVATVTVSQADQVPSKLSVPTTSHSSASAQTPVLNTDKPKHEPSPPEASHTSPPTTTAAAIVSENTAVATTTSTTEEITQTPTDSTSPSNKTTNDEQTTKVDTSE